MTARILRTKITPPRPRPGLVVRPRLIERLRPDADVWLVSAGAGYGKTTLVAQAADAHGLETAWVRADAADDDPIRFFSHLAAALASDESERDTLLETAVADGVASVVDAVIAAVERVERDRPVVLVLDDLHEITSVEVRESLRRFMTHLPEQLILAITTRTDPPLPIGRLRAHGALVDIRASDLAFDEVETGQLFADGPELSAGEVQALRAGTEGWATGLRLLSMATSDSGSTGVGPSELLQEAATDDLGDFLAAEVLAAQQDDVATFLIETSLLDDLCPDSCGHLTGRDDTLAVLRDLHRRQVFIEPVDAATDTYRYHPLLRAFLQRRAEELDPLHLEQLHRRASQWYRSAEMPTPAIDHAMSAGDDDGALEMIRTWFGPYAQMGLLTTAHGWLERYGIERCRALDDLRTAAAWAALNARRYDEVLDWVGTDADAGRPASYRVQAHTIRSHRLRHLADVAGARREASAAVGLARTDELASHDCSFAFAASLKLDQLDGVADEDAVTAALRQGEAHDNDSSVLIARSTRALARSLTAELHDLAAADVETALAMVTGPALERFHQPIAAHLALARIGLARGALAEALDHATHAGEIAATGREPLLEVMCLVEVARAHHAQGAVDDARSAVRRAERLGGEGATAHVAELVRRVRNETRFVTPSDGLPAPLSDRETAVLRLLPRGMTRKRMGEELFVSENTIKTHLTSLRHKLGVTGGAAEIVARAREIGLLPPDG